MLGAYEWGLADKTKKANAALAGLGTTRRILVSDTMLADYTDEEIEIVLAHELAHHVHGDIWKGIAFESALVVAGFFLAARALEGSVAWLGLEGASDPAGLPLLLLAAGAGYATYTNWDFIKEKLSLDDLTPGRVKAIDMAKKDYTFDGLQPNSIVLSQRARNNEIKLSDDPWTASRINTDRWLVTLTYQQEGQVVTHQFDCNIATGNVKLVPQGAQPPR